MLSASSLPNALYMVKLHSFILAVAINHGHKFSEALYLGAGDSFNSFLVAIVAVEPDVLKAWAASEGIQVYIIKPHSEGNSLFLLKCNEGSSNVAFS